MRDFKNVKRVVVKIGSSSLVNKDLSINLPVIVNVMENFKNLIDKNIEVVLVTSGAIALGMHELGMSKKPSIMALKQACAALGQAKLMEAYNKASEIYNLKVGQILVNHDDFQVRKRMLYLTNTLDEMFKQKIIPIINENDALAVDEIKVGDNDTLASMIAPIVKADLLILFSDIDGLYDKNPKLYQDAKLINEISEITDELNSMVSDSSTNVGTGGMITKITAAKIATSAKVDMIICNSNRISNILDIINGDEIGTLFKKNEIGITTRDHWLIYSTNSCGAIILDKGLINKLSEKKVSILAKGVTRVTGEFLRGSIIDVLDENGKKIAKGITNFSSNEIDKIKGLNTKEYESVLNHLAKKEIIHANDLVIL